MSDIPHLTARMSAGGRIVIPAKFRKKIGLKEGDDVFLQIKDGRLQILTRDQAIRDIQEYVCSFVPPGVSLVDELIRDRREEAARE